jgi:hypothetical protein
MSIIVESIDNLGVNFRVVSFGNRHELQIKLGGWETIASGSRRRMVDLINAANEEIAVI